MKEREFRFTITLGLFKSFLVIPYQKVRMNKKLVLVLLPTPMFYFLFISIFFWKSEIFSIDSKRFQPIDRVT